MRIRTHTNPLCYRQRFEKIDPVSIYPNFSGTLDLEIGFGQCSFIRNYAQANPTRLIIGVEVRKKAVELMQAQLRADNIQNAYLVHGNGLFCLQDVFLDQSLDTIFIFHPDPWIKQRHSKRRVINQAFISNAAQKLKIGGKIHVSTDVEFLWQEICDFFEAHTGFSKKDDDLFWECYYVTRWDEISIEKQRKTFYSTFCKI